MLKIKNLNLSKIKMGSGLTLAERMEKEARLLYDCIQQYIDNYYSSYAPTIYERSYYLQNALFAEKIADIRIDKTTMSISVVASRSMVIHDSLGSVWANDGQIPLGDGSPHPFNTLIGLNYGWKANGLAYLLGHHVPNLTYHRAVHFIEDGIKEYNRINKMGIKVKIPDLRKE